MSFLARTHKEPRPEMTNKSWFNHNSHSIQKLRSCSPSRYSITTRINHEIRAVNTWEANFIIFKYGENYSAKRSAIIRNPRIQTSCCLCRAKSVYHIHPSRRDRRCDKRRVENLEARVHLHEQNAFSLMVISLYALLLRCCDKWTPDPGCE